MAAGAERREGLAHEADGAHVLLPLLLVEVFVDIDKVARRGRGDRDKLSDKGRRRMPAVKAAVALKAHADDAQQRSHAVEPGMLWSRALRPHPRPPFERAIRYLRVIRDLSYSSHPSHPSHPSPNRVKERTRIPNLSARPSGPRGVYLPSLAGRRLPSESQPRADAYTHAGEVPSVRHTAAAAAQDSDAAPCATTAPVTAPPAAHEASPPPTGP